MSFFLEITQCKYYFYDKLNINYNDDWRESYMIPLPNGIPKSKLLTDKIEFQAVWEGIFNKYIGPDCQRQVNISYPTRKRLILKFANRKYWKNSDNLEDKMTMYDQAIHDIWGLLHVSFIRFQKTHQYKKLMENLNVNP